MKEQLHITSGGVHRYIEPKDLKKWERKGFVVVEETEEVAGEPVTTPEDKVEDKPKPKPRKRKTTKK